MGCDKNKDMVKINFLFVFVVGVLIISMSAVAAYDTIATVGSTDTLIKGKLSCSETGNNVGGVEVLVKCYHVTDGITRMNRKKNMSTYDGNYAVYFQASQCDQDDKVVVEVKGNSFWNAEGVVKDRVLGNIDIAVVDIASCSEEVPIVPEFGLIAGITTVLGACGTFFIIRKKARISKKHSK